jgi:hypothetical protein
MVWDLATSHAVARCLHVVAELGVADALDDAPATAGELAARTSADADALSRMLRLLAGQGVFALGPQGYVHTPTSELLRSDHPQSMRGFVRMMGMPVVWNDFTELAKPATTGEPALNFGALVAYFADHPNEAAIFNQAMDGKSAGVIPAVVAAYDFTPFHTVADIGGGHGNLIRAILEAAPAASGVLFDLPHVIADTTDDASHRLRLQPGDFFADALPVADAYVLMEVIHDWPDDEAAEILAAVRRAAPGHARLVIVEALVPEVAGPHFSKTLDVVMLAVTGGRERTPAEYDQLLKAAGFRFERVVPTASQYSVVEATVA